MIRLKDGNVKLNDNKPVRANFIISYIPINNYNAISLVITLDDTFRCKVDVKKLDEKS